MVYNCAFCSREYKEKFNYERHIGYCEFINKSTREQINELEVRDEPLPTTRQLYQWMQEMALRIAKLEKENAKLKQVQKRKIDIIEWLNTSNQPKPTIPFTLWIKTRVFPKIHTVLEKVYETDLLHGIHALFDTVFSETCDFPIRAFESKNNTFYVFDRPPASSEPTWLLITTTQFDKQLAKIFHHFIVEFVRTWYTPNETRIELEEAYKDKYVNYYQKILGGNKLSEEAQFQRIRHNLYSRIKENVKSIIEFDVA